MKILILSWRDIKHPLAGGAEILTYEICRRLVQFGYSVSWFSARTKQQSRKETIDGITFIRRGTFYSVHLLGIYLYLTQWRGNFDLIVDQIHGIPFFTPLFVKEKTIALICEVADKIWFAEWPFPISILGSVIEHLYLTFYRSIPFLTISKSTKRDLVKKGIKHVNVVCPGITLPTVNPQYTKESTPTFISLGRLTPMKRINETILAFSLVSKQRPDAKLWIVGKGKYHHRQHLFSFANKLGLENKVRFWGHLPEDKKWELLQKSWAILSTSIKEGWGLVVIEANRVGTPAITYNVPGLNESIINNQTGLLTTNNTPKQLAQLMTDFINNEPFRNTLSQNAQKWSKQFSWDKATSQTIKFLESL